MTDKTQGRCVLKYLRMSPRKVNLVCATIRRKPAKQAQAMLVNMKKKAAHFLLNALKSAVANAKVLKLDESRLYVAEAKADCGPLMKRFMTRSMGRADRMVRRTVHVTVIVKEGKKFVPPVEKKAAGEAPKKVSKKEKQGEKKS